MTKSNTAAKILIIGGGQAQAVLVEELLQAKDLNVFIADDRNIASRNYQNTTCTVLPINRYDLAEIKNWTTENYIDYITSEGSDRGVYVAATIAEALSIPFYCSPSAALQPMNKYTSQKLLASKGVPVPWTLLISNAGEIVDALKSSGNGNALLQHYCEGEELGINGIKIDKTFHLLTAAYRQSSRARDAAFGVAMEKATIVLDEKAVSTITTTIQKACEVLNLANTPIYCQGILSEPGDFTILEIMPRLGGGEDPRLVATVTGYNLTKNCFFLSIGKAAETPPAYNPKSHGLLRFLKAPPGEITSVQGVEQALQVAGVVDARVYFSVGDELSDLKSSRERCGFLLVRGQSMELCKQLAAQAEKCITIMTK